MAMICGGYNGTNWGYENSETKLLKAEVSQLKFELEQLKGEMEEMKKLMSAKASFTDFKVFKFNEEEEKRMMEVESIRLDEMQRRINQLIR